MWNVAFWCFGEGRAVLEVLVVIYAAAHNELEGNMFQHSRGDMIFSISILVNKGLSVQHQRGSALGRWATHAIRWGGR
jgi:hypothetical protein